MIISALDYEPQSAIEQNYILTIINITKVLQLVSTVTLYIHFYIIQLQILGLTQKKTKPNCQQTNMFDEMQTATKKAQRYFALF